LRELYDGFATSVKYIATLGRMSAPDNRHYLSYWVDACQIWARLNNIAPFGNVGASFFLAAIAMGVPYQLGNHAMGVLPAVGLREHGGERMTADGWKRSLAGDVLLPTQPERRFSQPSPAQVFVGGR